MKAAQWCQFHGYAEAGRNVADACSSAGRTGRAGGPHESGDGVRWRCREASAAETNNVAEPPAPFGPSEFNLNIDGLGGGPDGQAGDHPYEHDDTIGLDNSVRASRPRRDTCGHECPGSQGCGRGSAAGFRGEHAGGAAVPAVAALSESNCPADTIVGHILTEPQGAAGANNSPIYNLVPERGVPAEFGYIDILHGAHVFYSHVVPTPAGYVLQVERGYPGDRDDEYSRDVLRRPGG